MSLRPPAAHFAWAGDFAEGLAPVMAQGKYGYLDTTGRMAIAPAFDAAGGFSHHRAPVFRDGAWGYLDVTGRLVVAAAFDWAGPFREGFAPVADSTGYFFIDTAGARLGTQAFTEIRFFSEGMAAVKIGGEDSGSWGFLDARGDMAIPPLFAGVPRGFSEGLAAVEVDREAPDRVGFINTSGGFALDTLFDAAGDFSEGLAPVGRGQVVPGRQGGAGFRGIWGFVDTAGKMALPPAYTWAGGFRQGKALVRLAGGNYAYIGKDGKVKTTFPDSLVPIPPRTGELTAFRLRERYGYLNDSGDQTLPARYREAGPFSDGWARARMGSSSEAFWVYVDRTGSYLTGNNRTPVTSGLPQGR